MATYGAAGETYGAAGGTYGDLAEVVVNVTWRDFDGRATIHSGHLEGAMTATGQFEGGG